MLGCEVQQERRTETRDVAQLVVLPAQEHDKLVHNVGHLALAEDLDQLAETLGEGRVSMDVSGYTHTGWINGNVRLDGLVLDLGNLILDELHDLLEDLVLYRLVAEEAVRVLLDLGNQVIQTHVPIARCPARQLLRVRACVRRRTGNPGQATSSTYSRHDASDYAFLCRSRGTHLLAEAVHDICLRHGGQS